MSYNGWTNKPTWLVDLWFSDNFDIDKEEGVDVDADYMKEFVEWYCEDVEGGSGFITDLLNYVLAEVNWEELAKHCES